MNVIARSFLNSMILAILVTAALLTSTGYVFFTVGSIGLKEAKDLARSRGMEVGLAIAQLAGERFEGEASVKLSSVMGRVVEVSESRFEDFVVNEIFMTDIEGRLIAHSNVALLADEAQNPYGGEDFERILSLSKRSPARIRVLKEKDIEPIPLFHAVGSLSEELGAMLKKTFPAKVTTEYHVGAAVFPVDQELPAGAVHMFVTVNTMNEYVTALRHYSVNTLMMVAGFVFFIAFIMFFLMNLTFRDTGEVQRRRSPPAARRAVLDEEDEGDEGILAPKHEPVQTARRPSRASGGRAAVLPEPEMDPIFDEGPGEEFAAHASHAQSEDVVYEESADDLFLEEEPPVVAAHRDDGFIDDRGQTEYDASPYAGDSDHATARSYRSAERIMDAIPLDRMSRSKMK